MQTIDINSSAPGTMSASPATLVLAPGLDEGIDKLETAFSQLPTKSRRRAYGSVTPQGKENSSLGNVMNLTDLFPTDMTKSDHGVSLFSEMDDDGYPSDVDGAGDNLSDASDDTVDMSGET